jgi:hypothetical protein
MIADCQRDTTDQLPSPRPRRLVLDPGGGISDCYSRIRFVLDDPRPPDKKMRR